MTTDHIGILIKKTSQAFEKSASQVLAPYDLTPSQFKILKYVTLNPEASVRQIDLETYFGMSNPTVTGIIQNLEKKGMIYRQSHPDDKRSKIIILSEKAKNARHFILETSDNIEANFTKGLTPQEKDIMRTLLLKLLESSQNI
ncbi:MarR family winged helix-turn-helix transcriptional regulator [Streptococcus uberis]|uniref:MarR family winged helix-turn-helix transcriptional regulator n=1 Tax=Streptococcus uberis TaxID=1349 RepID=UPI0006202912|nr:MarR family transcriptional regulator [Streptococcus uberis]KKF48801.1 MarR family transcriptional regulator [Streptococcus uberis S6261]KKF54435.1 MarR family transcriptional regulator [Streptococcus uberis B190]MCR4254009.1 MarR family transcriptional regulator [Streptococcus uberis]MCR4255824.1 MarR family transcriptional regulator [Streptococcus uberis]MCR4260498.1 MarR family transcriptional regulator [Streptococcus uberis]